MSASTYHEDHCDHVAWTCQGGWHECTDCNRGLGGRFNQLEAHDAHLCEGCEADPEDPPAPEKMQFGFTPAVSRQFKGSGKTITKQEIRDTVADAVSSKYVTKDSGKREEYDSGMVRDVQENKPRFDLLFTEGVPYGEQFFTRVAELLGRGAEKYGERNWQLANSEEELDRFKASGLRHMLQWMTGEVDEDHASAVVFNLMAAEYVKGKLKRENVSEM